jgi:hypothetical protein
MPENATVRSRAKPCVEGRSVVITLARSRQCCTSARSSHEEEMGKDKNYFQLSNAGVRRVRRSRPVLGSEPSRFEGECRA